MYKVKRCGLCLLALFWIGCSGESTGGTDGDKLPVDTGSDTVKEASTDSDSDTGNGTDTATDVDSDSATDSDSDSDTDSDSATDSDSDSATDSDSGSAVQSCDPDPCVNGECVEDSGSFSCSCTAPYAGDFCDQFTPTCGDGHWYNTDCEDSCEECDGPFCSNQCELEWWHTFFGGTGGDSAFDMALDSSGNIYIVGSSLVSWTGTSGAQPINAHSEGLDIAVLKLNSAGGYLWHTFLGGSGDSNAGNNNAALAVTVDQNDNPLVVGRAYSNWNGPGDTAPKNAHNGTINIVAAKLNSAGAYQWHTFIGGSNTQATDVGLDNLGNVYISGYTYSGWNGPGDTAPIVGYAGSRDMVVIKLDSQGEYKWHTFAGGADGDSAQALSVDSSGTIHVLGDSHASWNGPGSTPESPLGAHSGERDLAFLKLNSSGAYQWHTFIGGASDDAADDIVPDDNGNWYLLGTSNANYNGPAGQPPRRVFTDNTEINDEDDIVVTKLSGTGTYQWHTFLGGANYDRAEGIDVDSNGNIYVVGTSNKTWDGPDGQEPLRSLEGVGASTIVAKLDNDGSYQWHSFFPMTGGRSVFEDNDYVLVGGDTTRAWTGPYGEGYLHTYTLSIDFNSFKFKP